MRGVPLAKKSGQSKPSKKPAKPAVKKPAAKPAAKPLAKKIAKSAKPVAKPPAAKPAEKAKPTKVAAKVPAPKAAPKVAPKAAPAPAAKSAPKPAAGGKSSTAPTAQNTSHADKGGGNAAGGAGGAGSAGGAGGAGGRKGITIVSPKPQPPKKPVAKKNISADIAALAGQLMSGGAVRKPLISSGPNAPSLRPLGLQDEGEEAPQKVVGKSPLAKKDLERFRLMLVRKRAELLGDITTLEQEALRGESGSLSNLPQHLAEQGSETYEQSLQLDLAAQDRKLIKEIDEAISRIDNGSYGVCEITGKPIKMERLEELPWARYTIEAQRELERRSMRS